VYEAKKLSTVFCIGGGPSLKGFDWSKLSGKNVIAVNRAFEVLGSAQTIYFSDLRFWNWYSRDLIKHPGVKITGDKRILDANVVNYKFTGTKGLDTTPKCLRSGNSSGYAAINLAVHMGAKNIILLGYDMEYVGKVTHWHDGYSTRPGKIHKMLPYFSTLVEPLKELKIDVTNTNLKSSINCFPKASFDEVLQIF